MAHKWNTLFYLLIFGFVGFNAWLLFKKSEGVANVPLSYMNFEKPTLVVFLDEMECMTCVESLLFLNQLAADLKEEGQIEIRLVILSGTGSDEKNLSERFQLPSLITSNFSILERLNITKTPLLVGITPEHNLVYHELLEVAPSVDPNHVRFVVLDRLYAAIKYD